MYTCIGYTLGKWSREIRLLKHNVDYNHHAIPRIKRWMMASGLDREESCVRATLGVGWIWDRSNKPHLYSDVSGIHNYC